MQIADFPHSMCKQTAAQLAELEQRVQDQGGQFAVQVIADRSGVFCGNRARYETLQAAIDAAESLAGRWFLVKEYRIAIAD